MKPILKRNCYISKCKKYRWSLDLKISDQMKEIIFIGLNPSLSDSNFTDNTTKKIINISDNYNYGKIKIINLFGLISKSPKSLLTHIDPVGFLNDVQIERSLQYWAENNYCDLWLGWGNHGNIYKRNEYLLEFLMKYHFIKKKRFKKVISPFLIKYTIMNHPIHPLYCSNKSKFIEYL